MNILEVENLSLAYGKQQVLDDISFEFKKGKIIGLLGPNGAGKSSILKVLAGLVFADSGKLKINNQSQTEFHKVKSITGFHIDSPSFYPFLSAKENLYLLMKMNQKQIDIDVLLRKVGLENVGSKKVRFFSTGMKQRLAIAQTLLRSPELLILDEPFNGLDPNGFQDLIDLIQKLNAEGITIVVSSHLLNELEQLAEHFILLHHGKIALDISKKELQKSKNKVEFNFISELTEASIQLLNDKKAEFISENRLILKLNPKEVEQLVLALVHNGNSPVKVETLTLLQEKYLEITV
ncbi:MAG: hypothetical protein BM563_10565 [Bacteroidetes bacterium MedPE-SWsnd-G1]|nr:MAG: hypothetical protein BM563_10565 [Bacteroidetes bacterium MedPE-SWsnd-G1]